MLYLLLIVWLLSPAALIPAAVKKSKDNAELQHFIDELCRKGRISNKEYISHKVEMKEESPAAPENDAEFVFSDSRGLSRAHGSAASPEKTENPAPAGNAAEAALAEEKTPAEKYSPYDLSYVKKSAQSASAASETLAAKPFAPAEKAISLPAEKTVCSLPENYITAEKPLNKIPAAKPAKEFSPENKRAAAMSVLMMIGIIFVILAGLVFSTAVWVTLENAGRTLAIGTVAAMFFGISAFIGKKLKLSRTSFAFYTLGTFFASITFITAGFFGLMGEYLSVTGSGSCLLYALALLMTALLSAAGYRIFKNPASAYISVFSGVFSAVLALVDFSDNTGMFALLSALLAVISGFVIYAFDLKLPEKWERPVYAASAALDIIALTGAFAALFGGNDMLIAACAVYIFRSIASAVLAFKGHSRYEKAKAAVPSLAYGAFFTLVLMWKLAGMNEVFALSAAIFAVLFSFAVFTLSGYIPREWLSHAKLTSFILSAAGMVSSLFFLMESFGEWNAVCFAAAGIYIASSFACGILAACGHEICGKAPSAFASMFTGLVFSVLLIAELSCSAASAALCLTALLLVLLNAVYTIRSKLPAGWDTALGAITAVTGAISIFTSLYVLIENYGEWDVCCFITASMYVIQAVVIAAAAFKGHGTYSRRRWSVIPQITGVTFALLIISQIASSSAGYMLIFTAFAALYLNLAFTFGKHVPENWRLTSKILSSLLGVYGAVFAACRILADSEPDICFYISAAIYIAYSLAAAAAAFFGHSEYSKRRWAIASQFTAIPLITVLISKLASDHYAFALAFTVFAVLYLNSVHSFNIKAPEKWELPLKIYSAALGSAGLALTVCVILADSVITPLMYISAGIYFIYSIAVTAAAFFRHEEYSKPCWAAASQAVGIILTLCMLYKHIYPSSSGLFVLSFVIAAMLYSAARRFILPKMPEEWENPAKSADIIFNISAACASGYLLIINNHDCWDKFCYITAAIYIAFTAYKGAKKNNALFKAAECLISTLTVYELYLAVSELDIGFFAVPEFTAVCAMFILSLIHHFAKPLRNHFSDIFLTLALAFWAVSCLASCGYSYELAFSGIYAIAAPALLCVIMLLKALENKGTSSAVFRALLPLPAAGIIYSAVYYYISESMEVIAAAEAAVSAVIASAVMIKALAAKKKPDISFCSFAWFSAAMVFAGSMSGSFAVLAALLAVSVLLTALFFRCCNNLPSLVTMAGSALVIFRIAEELPYEYDHLKYIFAAVFAVVSLIASRISCGRKFLEREEGTLKLDTCSSGVLFSIPLVISSDEKTSVFSVLLLISAYLFNLVRKEHNGDLNRVFASAASALLSLALIFRPFLTFGGTVAEHKITLIIICAFSFAFSKIWGKYPRLAENFSSALYGICFVCLIIDALADQTLVNTFTVLGTSAAILLYSFISKKKRWFAVSAIALIGLTVYTFRDFFMMIDWWIYLLIVGLVLITVSAANEYFVRKGRELKEKAGRFFEDWSW